MKPARLDLQYSALESTLGGSACHKVTMINKYYRDNWPTCSYTATLVESHVAEDDFGDAIDVDPQQIELRNGHTGQLRTISADSPTLVDEVLLITD